MDDSVTVMTKSVQKVLDEFADLLSRFDDVELRLLVEFLVCKLNRCEEDK